MTTDPKKPQQDMDAEREAWVQRQLANAPEWSDEKWRRMFAHFGLELVEEDTDPDTTSEDGQ